MAVFSSKETYASPSRTAREALCACPVPVPASLPPIPLPLATTLSLKYTKIEHEQTQPATLATIQCPIPRDNPDLSKQRLCSDDGPRHYPDHDLNPHDRSVSVILIKFNPPFNLLSPPRI